MESDRPKVPHSARRPGRSGASVRSALPASGGTRQDRKAATRSALIEAATGLVAERGFLTAATADVAQRAGVSHGTVFVHFPRREDLLIAVLDRFGVSLAAELRRVAATAGDLRATLEAHLTAIRTHEALYARLVADSPGLPAPLRAAAFQLQSGAAWYFRNAADRDVTAGRIKDLPRVELFNSWLGLIHHYLINRDLFAPGGSLVALKGADLTQLFMAMVSIGPTVMPQTDQRKKGTKR